MVRSDETLPATASPTGDAQFTLVWTTATAPVDNDDATDGRERAVGLSLPGGSVQRIVDLLPGRRSAMHRTNSLDYGIVLSGVVEPELDGAVTTVNAGEIIASAAPFMPGAIPARTRPCGWHSCCSTPPRQR